MYRILPDELLTEISSYLDDFSRAIVRQVGKRLHSTALKPRRPLRLQHGSSLFEWSLNNGFRGYVREYYSLDLLKLALSKKCKIHDSIFHEDEVVNNINVVKWLHVNWRIPLHFDVTVCRAGNLDILKYLHKHGLCRDYICTIAARRGVVEILEWSFSTFKDVENRAELMTTEAVIYNCLKTVKWLIEEKNFKGESCVYSRATVAAVSHGRFEILQFLLEHNFPMDEVTGLTAVNRLIEEGTSDCLDILLKKHCPFNDYTRELANRHGFSIST